MNPPAAGSDATPGPAAELVRMRKAAFPPQTVARNRRAAPAASVRDIRSELFAAGPEMAGRTLPAMTNLFAAGGAVSPARAAAPAQDPRSGLTQ